MSERPAFSTTRVKCTNRECADVDVDRVIELPHLGDSVFIMPTVPGLFGLPMVNLLCGTCAKTEMTWAV